MSRPVGRLTTIYRLRLPFADLVWSAGQYYCILVGLAATALLAAVYYAIYHYCVWCAPVVNAEHCDYSITQLF